MKHLIAFLGYSQSRIQHPVYRQFVQAPIARRNATLLFQSRPLEERELVHEINELRRREGRHCELTFHICASLTDPAMGQQIVQTVTMIHRLYDCPSYVYGLLPDLTQCSDEQRKNVWKCLSTINNGVTDYPHMRLISHCFLYHDATQVSLAKFLYHVTRQPEALDLLERYGYMNKVMKARRTGDQNYEPEFPAIFSTFNATDITYPDGEVRYYIHQSYLNALLSLSRPQSNAIDMEQCNEHVQQMLGLLPLSDVQLALADDTFIELPQEAKHRPWMPVTTYWKGCMDTALHDLEDRPREEWLNLLHNAMEVYYQSRFREMGVDYFFKQQRHHTSEYCAIMLHSLRASLRQVMCQHPYPPETSQDITRSLINNLQQQALRFDRQTSDFETESVQLKSQLDDLRQRWDEMGFFDRMRGKDKAILDEYRTKLLRHYMVRTLLAGAGFATKLLNELIPQVAALPNAYSSLAQLCQESLEATVSYLSNNQPSSFVDATFASQPILDAAQAVRVDQSTLRSDYARLQEILYGKPNGNTTIEPLDSETLLQTLRDELTPSIDRYIHQRIQDGTMSPVLDVSVSDRLASAYAERGGLTACIDQMKQETALSLKLKEEGGHNEQYLLIAPECDGLGSYIRSSDTSSVQLLHILTNISLTDLDGFAGQRMFVEPSMF